MVMVLVEGSDILWGTMTYHLRGLKVDKFIHKVNSIVSLIEQHLYYYAIQFFPYK